MTDHVLKTVEPYFSAVESGAKNFDVRRNDRAFQTGDTVTLVDTSGCDCRDQTCDKRRTPIRRRITFIYGGDPRFKDIEPGHVVLGLADIEPVRTTCGDTITGLLSEIHVCVLQPGHEGNHADAIGVVWGLIEGAA